jgi:hypothetical protein
MALRIARGLFRLWIVGTALFVIAVAAVSYSDIKAEFDRPKPNKIFEVQAPDGRTFELKAPDMQTAMSMATRLAKDYVPDKPQLSDYDVFTPEPNPWASVATAAGVALGIPLVVLVLGASLAWAFSGFAAKRP